MNTWKNRRGTIIYPDECNVYIWYSCRFPDKVDVVINSIVLDIPWTVKTSWAQIQYEYVALPVKEILLLIISFCSALGALCFKDMRCLMQEMFMYFGL